MFWSKRSLQNADHRFVKHSCLINLSHSFVRGGQVAHHESDVWMLGAEYPLIREERALLKHERTSEVFLSPKRTSEVVHCGQRVRVFLA